MPIVATVRMETTPEVEGAIWGILKMSEAQIRLGFVRVRFYDSGVIYRMEPLGSEVWQSAKESLALGYFDCEDGVAWRCAELRVLDGEDATPLVRDVRPGLRHCLVRRADGRLECPSRARGMGGRPIVNYPVFVGYADAATEG